MNFTEHPHHTPSRGSADGGLSIRRYQLRGFMLMLIFIGALFFFDSFDHGLTEPLEGLNASVAIEMFARRDVFTPRLSGVPYNNVSMLSMWLNMCGLGIIGWNELAVRLFPFIAALLTCVLVYSMAQKIYSGRSGLIAMTFCGTTILFFVSAQIGIPASVLTFLNTLALYGLFVGISGGNFLIFHIANTFLYLGNGVFGFIVPWIILIAYSIFTKRYQLIWRAASNFAGMVIFVAAVSVSTAVIAVHNPSIVLNFAFGYAMPSINSIITVLLLLPLAVAPWCGVYYAALCDALPPKFDFIEPSRRISFLLFLWSVIFMISGLLHGDAANISTIAPSLAVLGAGWFQRLYEQPASRKLHMVKKITFLNVGYCLVILLAEGILHLHIKPLQLLLATMPLLIFLALFLISVNTYSRRGDAKKFMRWCGVTAFLILIQAAAMLDIFAAETSARLVGLSIRKNISTGDVVMQYGHNSCGLPFYTGRQCLVVNEPSDILVNPFAPKMDDEAMLKYWNDTQRRAFIVIDRKQQLKINLPGDIYSIAETAQSVILSNHR